jgi:hypothetical protein
MGGSRITEQVWLHGILYSDPLPVLPATGVGNVAPLQTLITMKVNVITSGLDTIRYGANTGGRKIEDVQKDIADVAELVRLNHLGRDLHLGHEQLQRQYERIFDGRPLL